MLSMYVSSHQKDWDIFLPYVLFAYRTSIHSATNETPFFLTFGRDPRLPTDLMINFHDEEKYTIEEYKQKLVDNFVKVKEEVRHLEEVIREKREAMEGLKKKEHNFRIGDIVWVFNRSNRKGISPKLEHPWHGPFRIIDLVTPVNVKVSRVAGKSKEQIIHVSRLKKYVSPNRPIEELELENDLNLEEDNNVKLEVEGEFEVDKILGKRKRFGNQDEYLIKWKGWSRKDSSWEPISHLKCSEKLEEFENMDNNYSCRICKKENESRHEWRRHFVDKHRAHHLKL